MPTIYTKLPGNNLVDYVQKSGEKASKNVLGLKDFNLLLLIGFLNPLLLNMLIIKIKFL